MYSKIRAPGGKEHEERGICSWLSTALIYPEEPHGHSKVTEINRHLQVQKLLSLSYLLVICYLLTVKSQVLTQQIARIIAMTGKKIQLHIAKAIIMRTVSDLRVKRVAFQVICRKAVAL